MSQTTQSLVNLPEGINILLTAEKLADPSIIVKELNELECSKKIGVVQLKSLLAGRVENVGDFMVIDEEVEAESNEELKEKMSEVGSETVSDDDLTALLEAGEGRKVETKDETKVDTSKDEIKVETKDEIKVDTSKAKAALGISGDTDLTPAEKTSSTRKPRKDVPALIAKAEKGGNKELLKQFTEAKFAVVDVEKSERWFSFVGGEHEAKMSSPRFDVSPRKNGDFGISLYVDSKASGVKTVIKGEDKLKQLISWTASKEVKDAIAG